MPNRNIIMVNDGGSSYQTKLPKTGAETKKSGTKANTTVNIPTRTINARTLNKSDNLVNP